MSGVVVWYLRCRGSRYARDARRRYASLYAAVYSRVYRRRMRWLHARGRHGPLMANGRCTWCGVAAGPVRGLT